MAFSDRIRDIAMEGLRKRHSSAPEGALKAIYFKEMYGVLLPRRPEGQHHERPCRLSHRGPEPMPLGPAP
jgi:hypothetical protein